MRAAAMVAALGGALACGGGRPGAPLASSAAAEGGAAAPDGISLALYGRGLETIASVDDRRTVEVRGGRILLDRIDPTTPLASIVIEPLDPARPLALGPCARERLEAPGRPGTAALGVVAPLLVCATAAPPGRYRVRVHHVATGSRFTPRHEIAMTAADRATVATRFSLDLPAWRAPAEVSLHDAAPGTGARPRELGRGAIVLDGTAVLELPPREVPARIVFTYRGHVALPIEPTEPAWGGESQHAVHAALELDDPALSLIADAHVRVALGDEVYELDSHLGLDDPANPAAGPRRLELWLVPALHGARRRTAERGEGGTLVERVELAVASSAGEPVDVWLEEPLRPKRRRSSVRAERGGAPPVVTGDVARVRVRVPAGGTARYALTIRYAPL